MANQKFTSTVTLNEGCQVVAESRGFKVIIDEPEQMGGTNTGMTPVELLLSALGSCLTVTISMFSKAFHVDIKDLKVEVEGDLDPSGAMGKNEDVRIGYSSIRINIHVVSDAPRNKIDKLVKMAEEKCPVSDTLKLGAPINASYEIYTEIA